MDLTAAGRRILEAMVLPGGMLLTTTDLCARADVERRHAYTIMGRPEFRRAKEAIGAAYLHDHLAPILAALARSASIDGRDGHPDRKLCLEMLGMYTPTSRKTVETITGATAPTDEQTLAAYLSLEVPERNWLPQIRNAYRSGRLRLPAKPVDSTPIGGNGTFPASNSPDGSSTS